MAFSPLSATPAMLITAVSRDSPASSASWSSWTDWGNAVSSVWNTPSWAETADKARQIGINLWQESVSSVRAGSVTKLQVVTQGVQGALSYGQGVLVGGVQKAVALTFKAGRKEEAVAEARQTIEESLHDPQFTALFDFLNKTIVELAQRQIAALAPTEGFIATKVVPQQGLLLGLLEVNLAKGFANLAQQLKPVPGQTTPTLVRLFTLLSRRAGACIDAGHLAAMEQKGRAARADLSRLKSLLFPSLDPLSALDREGWIREYIQTSDREVQRRIQERFFPPYFELKKEVEQEVKSQAFPGSPYPDDLSATMFDRARVEVFGEEKVQQVEEFLEALDRLNTRHRELDVLFGRLADEVLTCFFPEKFASMELPHLCPLALVQSLYDGYVKPSIVQFLRDGYESMAVDEDQQAKWRQDLQVAAGTDLSALEAAPLAALKGFIRGDQETLAGWVALGLQSAGLPQEQVSGMAKWMAGSLTAMLDTHNASLQRFGLFLEEGLRQLSLALMAKGAAALPPLPEGEADHSASFVKRAWEAVVAKTVLFTGGEGLPDEVWARWLGDLPLPRFLKDQLVVPLAEQFQALQALAFQLEFEWSAVEEKYASLQRKIEGYEKGAEWLQMLDKVSEAVATAVLEDNVKWAADWGVDEVLSAYLPGIEVSESLKAWWTQNVKKLGVTDNGASARVKLQLKQGVRAFLAAALVNLREGGTTDLARLLTDLREGVDVDQVVELRQQIAQTENRYQRLQAELAEKVAALDSELAWEEQLDSLGEDFARKSEESERLSEEIAEMRKLLNEQLAPCAEIFGTFVREQKEKWLLPPVLRERLWPFIESGLQRQTLFLFDQVAPLLWSVSDIQKNRDELNRLSTAGPFFAQLAGVVSKTVVTKMPTLIESVLGASRQMVLEEGRAVPLPVQAYALIDGPARLQELAVGQGELLGQNREALERHLEGWLLQCLVKSAESLTLRGGDPLALLEQKLRRLAEAGIAADAPENANQLVGKFLQEIGLSSPDDLDFLPPTLRRVVYEELNRQVHLQLQPMISSVMEQVPQRERLKQVSGSDFFGSICKFMALDIGETIRQLPVEKGQVFLKTMFPLLPTDALEQSFESAWTPERVQPLVGIASTYAEGILLRLFIRVAEKNPPREGRDTLFILTEKMLEKAGSTYLALQACKEEEIEKRAELATELNQFALHVLGVDSPTSLEGIPEALQELVFEQIKDQVNDYIGGILLEIRDHAKKLDRDAPETAGRQAPLAGVERNLVEQLCFDLSELIIQATPRSLFEERDGHLHGAHLISRGLESYVHALARGNRQTAAAILQYTQGLSWQTLLEETARPIADPDNFVEDKAKVSEWLGQMLLTPLTNLFERAVQFEEAQGAQFNRQLMAGLLQVAAEHFGHLNAAREIAKREGRTQMRHQDVVGALGESRHAAVATAPPDYAETLRTIRQQVYAAWTLSQWEQHRETVRKMVAKLAEPDSAGNRVMRNEELVRVLESYQQRVTGQPLSPEVVAWLQKGVLKDQIRHDADAPGRLRYEAAHLPASKVVMRLMFPRGQNDLFYVPEKLRPFVWGVYEEQLFPLLLTLMTESLLDPDMVNTMVLRSLETLRDSLLPLDQLSPDQLWASHLKGQLVLKTSLENTQSMEGLTKDELAKRVQMGLIMVKLEEPADPALDELDRASGALITEVLKMVDLPARLKKLVLDPANQKSLGAVLRQQFNDRFLKESLELFLAKATEGKKGERMFNFDPTSKEEKAAKAAESRDQVQRDLGRVSREVVDVSLSYLVSSKWEEVHSRFEALIQRLFGRMGLRVKQSLDAVFGFVFFKIVGTLLSFLLRPIKGWVKEILYAFIALDANRERLMSLWTQVPKDQPIPENYAMYHEDLVFKMGEVVGQTVDAFVKQRVTPPSEPA